MTKNALASALCSILSLLAQQAAAQDCEPHWLPGDAAPGADAAVYAMTSWDPDGPGPRGALLVAAGDFSVMQGTVASRIAAYDPIANEWMALGSGLSDRVLAVAGLPNGDLVAAGHFLGAGGVPVNYIARWDGEAWHPMRFGMDQYVNALAVLPNGDVVAGGEFTTAGDVAANRVARWDGSQWHAMGAGFNRGVNALIVRPNGQVAAGGAFGSSGLEEVHRVALWDGTRWDSTGLTFNGLGTVNAFANAPNGDLIATGNWVSGVIFIARWNGTNWNTLAGGGNVDPQGWGRSVLTTTSGDVIAGGSLSNSGQVRNVYRAVPSGPNFLWTMTLSGLRGFVHSLAEFNGHIYAGGTFRADFVNAHSLHHIVKWNGQTWEPLGAGPIGVVTTVGTLADGSMMRARSRALNTDPSQALTIERFDGAWETIGVGPPNSAVTAFLPLPDGGFVISGTFTSISNVNTARIAMWRDGVWSPLGAGLNAPANALLLLPGGDIVAGGEFTSSGPVSAEYVARWNGTAWSPMGSGTLHPIRTLAFFENGDIFAGLACTQFCPTPQYHLARWNGSAWINFTSESVAGIEAAANLPTGELVVGGTFTGTFGLTHRGVALWNGTSWSSLGGGINGSVRSLAVLPDGDLIAVGRFLTAGDVAAANIARWDGSSWSAVDGGLSDEAFAVAPGPDGSILAGGRLRAAGDVSSALFARYGVPEHCPCDSLDFNRDGLSPDAADLADFLSVFGGGPCSTGTCADLDYNNDGLAPDNGDIEALFRVFGGGEC